MAWEQNSTRKGVGKDFERSKPGALHHRAYRLPLLPSGPGGVGRRPRAQCLASSARSGGIVRRERDLNPWYPYEYTRLPIVRLRPLGHLSSRIVFTSARKMRRV